MFLKLNKILSGQLYELKALEINSLDKRIAYFFWLMSWNKKDFTASFITMVCQ